MIKELNISDVKKINVVELKTDGDSVVLVGGKNSAGKSTVLDSIMYAIAGGKSIPDQPIRKGQDTARIELKTDKLHIVRTFGKGGSQVTVKNMEGHKISSAQTILNSIYEPLTFDPLAFSRATAKDQKDLLCKLIGVDTESLDKERSEIYDNRRVTGRELKSAKGELDATTFDKSVESEVSVESLASELEKALAHNAGKDKLEVDREAKMSEYRMHEGRGKKIDEEIAELEAKIAVLKKEKSDVEGKLASIMKAGKEVVALIDAFAPIEESAIRKQMEDASKVNKVWQENLRHKEASKRVANLEGECESATKKIEEIDQSKAKMLAEAKMPMDGLGIEGDDVTFEGIPLSQASTAQQIRVSVAFGLAANPKLKVLLIREGSLLDEDSLRDVHDIAVANDAHVWIERVGSADESSVVIEDGMVLEDKRERSQGSEDVEPEQPAEPETGSAEPETGSSEDTGADRGLVQDGLFRD